MMTTAVMAAQGLGAVRGNWIDRAGGETPTAVGTATGADSGGADRVKEDESSGNSIPHREHFTFRPGGKGGVADKAAWQRGHPTLRGDIRCASAPGDSAGNDTV
jgi:hypothetical protein